MATRTKHYEAELKDLDHLLQVIESEMGPDAQLETMEYTKGGIMGLGGRRMISITATVEVNPQRIGSSIRRHIKLDDHWTTGTGEENASPPPAVAKADEPEDKLIDLSRRRTIPTGGGMAPERPARRARPEPPLAPEAVPEPLPEVLAEISEPPVAAVAETPAATTGAEPAQVEATPVAEPAVPEEAVAAVPEPEVEIDVVVIADEPELLQTLAESEEFADLGAFDDPEGHLEELAASMSVIREAVGRLHGENEGPAFVTEPDAGPPAAEPIEVTVASASSARMAETLRQVFDRLIDWNIRSADALKLIDAAMAHYADKAEPSPDGLFAATVGEMLRPLPAAPGLSVRPGQRRVVALVGSTGTGKTSVAAKLAARYAYERDLNVALVSMDTYRIAAVDQLRTFAEVMGFPLEIAYTADDFARLSEELRADLVIVDTAGRSPLNARQLDELSQAFAARRPDEVHLVLPATARYDDLALTLEAFAPVGPTATLVTKLDETRTLGALYNLSQLGAPPVSFFSTGQAIPEDLHEAQPAFLAGWAEGLGY